MIFNILDNTTELWMTKYIIGEIFSSGGATFYKNLSDQIVCDALVTNVTRAHWSPRQQSSLLGLRAKTLGLV